MIFFFYNIVSFFLITYSHLYSAYSSRGKGAAGIASGCAAGRTGAIHQKRPVCLCKIGTEKSNQRQEGESESDSLGATSSQRTHLHDCQPVSHTMEIQVRVYYQMKLK